MEFFGQNKFKIKKYIPFLFSPKTLGKVCFSVLIQSQRPFLVTLKNICSRQNHFIFIFYWTLMETHMDSINTRGREQTWIARFFLTQYTKTGQICTFSKLPQHYQMAKNYTEWPQNIPNGHKLYQHFPFQDPPKYTQIGIFGFENIPSGNPRAE
jgi:hypothetical protein